MEEQKASKSILPTKKQRQLLTFIEEFIIANGYSPSYREIMQGLKYNSVATVALHINNLIKRGHLRKRDRSARSLEVVSPSITEESKIVPKQLKATEEKWLVEKVEQFFKEIESIASVSEKDFYNLRILIAALRVLGAEGAANSFSSRLNELRKKQSEGRYLV
jgi:SOS-response transcriptional repressor LexA